MNLVALRTTLIEAATVAQREMNEHGRDNRELIEQLAGSITALDFYLRIPKCAGCGEALTPNPLGGQRCYCFNRHPEQLRVIAYRITPPGYPCMGKWEDGDISPRTEAHVKAQNYIVEKAYAQ